MPKEVSRAKRPHQLAIQVRSRVHHCYRRGRRLAQNGNEFVQVVGLAAQGNEPGLAGKQARQRFVVAVQVKPLPVNAALVEPAGPRRSLNAFAHITFGLDGQDQAMFYCFHISILNRYLLVCFVGGGTESGSPSTA